MLAIGGVFLAAIWLSRDARALDPHRQITQYGHTAWRTQDGFGTNLGPITQTTDGYIWIGVNGGIARFDGVRFTPWSPPVGQSLPHRGISSLLGSSDGSLWIGTYNGLSRYKDGKLFNYTSAPNDPGISEIIEDHAGAIWVTRYQVNDGKGSLCRVSGKELRCYGEKEGNPGRFGLGLTEDSEGNVWFGCRMLCRWTRGTFSTYFKDQLKNSVGNGVTEIAAGPSGSLWAALDGAGPHLGVQYYSQGKWASYVIPGFNGANMRTQALFVDRTQTLWVGTENAGLYHIHDGGADHYDSADGLSGNNIAHIYEDREGNLWVVTDKGLDLFRDTSVVNFSSSEGMGGSEFNSVLALTNGSVWIGEHGALDVIRRGHVSVMRAGQGLPGQDVQAMLEDHTGRIWLGVDRRLMIYEESHFVEVKKLDGSPMERIGITKAIAEGADGDIWAFLEDGVHCKLLRIRRERVQQEISLESSRGRVGYLAADRRGGVWVGDNSVKLVHYYNGRSDIVRLGNGDAITRTKSLFVASDDAVWAATTGGLYRWKDGRLTLMDTRNGLPCVSLRTAIEDDYGSLWLSAGCGLLKIPAQDLANWLRQPESKVSVRTFDALDGADPTGSGYQPTSSKSPDGRLWFAGSQGVQVIDPSQSYVNPIPPPVHVEEVVADRKEYAPQEGLRLAPLTHDLEIQYTALSFTVPQKVKFRYMLQGQDKNWQDAGTRREAFYTNLGPGHYQFHVIACNNDGVWNETGAAFGFDIPPAYYQTLWFRVLLALIAGAMVGSLYLLRLKQATAQVQARLDERMQERESIARELHDTLLQGFQGLMLRFQAVMEEIPDDQPARYKMEKVMERADEVLLEGRQRVSTLRGAKQEGDLAQAIASFGEGLALNHPAQFSMAVVGTPQVLDPVVLDETYRIGREALVNAFAHSNALKIEGEITYDSARLRLCIRDNGEGIELEILKSGKSGHWGISGMRERAQNIGGQFNLWSTLGAGTEVELIIPSKVAYRLGAKQNGWKWIQRIVSGWR